MKRILIISVFILLLTTCSRNVRPQIMDAEDEYLRAYGYFEEGNYGKAIELFSYFFNRHPGSEWIDDAQYYYSESYYRIGDYNMALQEFQFLVNNFSNSEYAQISLLRTAQCLEKLSPIVQRDQSMTRQALERYQEFIVRYPYSDSLQVAEDGRDRMEEKLNRKLLEIAEIYIKMRHPESAKVYLNMVVNRSAELSKEAYKMLGDIATEEGKDSLASYYYRNAEGRVEGETEKKLIGVQ